MEAGALRRGAGAGGTAAGQHGGKQRAHYCRRDVPNAQKVASGEGPQPALLKEVGERPPFAGGSGGGAGPRLALGRLARLLPSVPGPQHGVGGGAAKACRGLSLRCRQRSVTAHGCTRPDERNWSPVSRELLAGPTRVLLFSPALPAWAGRGGKTAASECPALQQTWTHRAASSKRARSDSPATATAAASRSSLQRAATHAAS